MPAKPKRPSPTPVEPAQPAVEPPAAKPIRGKLGVMVERLRRPDGATIAALAEATGWKENSVRGAMAGALKARGLVVSSHKPDDGPRNYRLPETAEPSEPAE